MWQSETNALNGGQVEQVQIHGAEGPLSWSQVIALWRINFEFSDWFAETLASAPFEALFWETPPLTRAGLGEVFEYVVVDSPALRGVRPERNAFAAHFGSESGAAGFDNLGGDAYLIAPCPGDRAQDFAHLAAFVRSATNTQNRALWRALAGALEARVSDRPLWCSTSGLGVYWLHVRLDSRPKYYTFDPYRQLP